MSRDALIPFSKMAGTGNDFIVVDARRAPVRGRRLAYPALAQAICERRAGIGADGLLVLEPSRAADVRMRIFNADGSEAEMCGNGSRCVGWFAAGGPPRNGTSRHASISMETGAGRVDATVQGSRVIVQLSDPTGYRRGVALQVGGRRLTADVINTGVPHAVIEVPRVAAVDVETLGRAIRHHAAFGPKGANANFIQPERGRAGSIQVRTYERGVEGETMACGTGSTAAAICYALRHGRARRGGRTAIGVLTQGGERLRISFVLSAPERPLRITAVRLDGPVRYIGEGTFRWPTQERG